MKFYLGPDGSKFSIYFSRRISNITKIRYFVKSFVIDYIFVLFVHAFPLVSRSIPVTGLILAKGKDVPHFHSLECTSLWTSRWTFLISNDLEAWLLIVSMNNLLNCHILLSCILQCTHLTRCPSNQRDYNILHYCKKRLQKLTVYTFNQW